MKSSRDSVLFCGQKLCIVTIYLLVATSILMALLGIYVNEMLFIESGFKVFTTLLILRLVLNGFKGVFTTAVSLLLLLLLFYSSIVYRNIVIFTYIFSCILIAIIFIDKIRGLSRVFLLINWYAVATSSLYLSVYEAHVKYSSMLVSMMIMIFTLLISRRSSILNRVTTYSRLQTKSPVKSTVDKLQEARALPSSVYGRVFLIALAVKSKLNAVEARILKIHVKTKKTINAVLHEMACLKLNTINSLNTLLAALETFTTLEKYISLFTGNIVSSLIRGTAGISRVEKSVASRFQTISIRVERLQHEVEHALIYILFLMSILLLTAIVFYAILYT